MKVEACMSTDIRIASPAQPIRDAARTMKEIDAGFLPVGENDRLVGIVTDRDIIVRALAERKTRARADLDGALGGSVQTLGAMGAKQKLAAIRMLFDWLVTGQIVPTNPAASVRGPKHVVKVGKTAVLDVTEARVLLDSINVTTQAGLRDRALISLMVYSFARVGAALAMKVEDVYVQNRRLCVRLHEKGGKISTRASPDIRCTGITSIHATKRHGEAVA